MSKLISINPFSEEVNAVFETITREELDNKILLAHSAFHHWKKSSQKKALMLRFAEVLQENQEVCARLQTQEM